MESNCYRKGAWIISIHCRVINWLYWSDNIIQSMRDHIKLRGIPFQIYHGVATGDGSGAPAAVPGFAPKGFFGDCGSRIDMYATTREEQEIMIAIQGLFPFFALAEGRSRNHEEREMRKLSHAMCFERMTMTPIDIIWAAEEPNFLSRPLFFSLPSSWFHSRQTPPFSASIEP